MLTADRLTDHQWRFFKPYLQFLTFYEHLWPEIDVVALNYFGKN